MLVVQWLLGMGISCFPSLKVFCWRTNGFFMLTLEVINSWLPI
jgi:hypothetical protein